MSNQKNQNNQNKPSNWEEMQGLSWFFCEYEML
jgi:hypothetical protein